MPVVRVGPAELVRAAQPVVAPVDLAARAILVGAVDLQAPVTPVGGVEALAILVGREGPPVPVIGVVVLAIHIGITGGVTLAMAGDGAIQDTAAMSDRDMGMAILTAALTPFMGGIAALTTATGISPFGCP